AAPCLPIAGALGQSTLPQRTSMLVRGRPYVDHDRLSCSLCNAPAKSVSAWAAPLIYILHPGLPPLFRPFLSSSYTASFADVQRARILLLAHQHPTWRNVESARQVGCCGQTVTCWRQRWHVTDCQRDAPRTGAPRTFTPLQRAQMSA